jgi:hypothetical protein
MMGGENYRLRASAVFCSQTQIFFYHFTATTLEAEGYAKVTMKLETPGPVTLWLKLSFHTQGQTCREHQHVTITCAIVVELMR